MHQHHQITIRCPLPGGADHGAIQPPFRGEDTRGVDKDHLGIIMHGNAANP